MEFIFLFIIIILCLPLIPIVILVWFVYVISQKFIKNNVNYLVKKQNALPEEVYKDLVNCFELFGLNVAIDKHNYPYLIPYYEKENHNIYNYDHEIEYGTFSKKYITFIKEIKTLMIDSDFYYLSFDPLILKITKCQKLGKNKV